MRRVILSKKVSFEEFTDSLSAIKDYMYFKVGNKYMHEARVIVFSGGEVDYNNILNVLPKIETNISFIDIIGDERFDQNYYSRYTNDYQKFAFIDGILLIKGEDRSGNPIEIDITSK